jgi:hypothetical protein
VALKKIVANMTMGNDMSPLFSDVVACMGIPALDVKKMVYLYFINYAKSKPDLARVATTAFTRVRSLFDRYIHDIVHRSNSKLMLLFLLLWW